MMMNPAIQEIGWVVLDLSQGNFANDVVTVLHIKMIIIKIKFSKAINPEFI